MNYYDLASQREYNISDVENVTLAIGREAFSWEQFSLSGFNLQVLMLR